MSKKKKQKYYAIKEGKGVKNKIVRTWSECKELVLGYPSIYKSFSTEEEARKMLENGEIKFIPCHHCNAVGPMGGITSPNMAVFVVENETGANRAYCTMNEGIGKVLRFGAYDEEVVNRLRWMRDVLGPTLGKALRSMENGLAINPLIAKAIAMGGIGPALRRGL